TRPTSSRAAVNAFAASAFLREMLSDLWPERTVEVINAGTTAVASFPVLGMLTEGIEYAPDLVVVYSGHNEFFGAYGVCSLHRAGDSPGAIRFQRWFRSLAVEQALNHLLPSGGDGKNKTLMEMMIGRSYTGPDDPRREAAARNLETHVARMIERCRARDIPIIVCTLPSNERDLAPLGTDDLSELAPDRRKNMGALLRDALSRLSVDPAFARQALLQALEIEPRHARARFALGRAYLSLNEGRKAAAEFQRAINLDSMPWRAPDASNEAIRRATTEPGAVLCDMRQVFRDASPHGSIGWELMDDHVHPSLKGQALIARAIVESLTTFKGVLAVDRHAYDALPDWEEYARRMGDNPYDRYAVAHTLRVLCDIPFYRKTNPEAFDRFHKRAEHLERSMPPEVVEVVRRWEGPTMHRGAKRPLSGEAARKLIAAGDYSAAERLLDVAARSVPPLSSWNVEYAYLMLACRNRRFGALAEADRLTAQRAIDRGKTLLRFGRSTNGLTERNIGRLHQLCDEYAKAIPFLLAARNKIPPGRQLLAADQALVDSYIRTGERDKALRIIEQGLKSAGDYVPVYRGLMNRLTQAGSGSSPTDSDRNKRAGTTPATVP
ncbi:MAG: tetratricopeptide repeat protein, partial [Phycisphaerae bacterium]